jgi:HPt (histidine-containing phosphotransfer) domain-containing protein
VTPDPSVDDQLDEIWRRARPRMLARVDAIERAIDALDAGADPEAVRTGSAEAHKIAGLAGTFSLQDATRLARSLEHTLEDRSGADPAALRRQADELRALLER